jgi:hypothetical protein
MVDADAQLMVRSAQGSASLKDIIQNSLGGGDGTKFLAGDGTLRTPPSGGNAGDTVQIGGYTIFVDGAGSLQIRTPDGTLVPLVQKT